MDTNEADHIPVPPFAAKPNPCADRGHTVRKLGRKLGYCTVCKAPCKPGGFDKACPGDRRQFMGNNV